MCSIHLYLPPQGVKNEIQKAQEEGKRREYFLKKERNCYIHKKKKKKKNEKIHCFA